MKKFLFCILSIAAILLLPSSSAQAFNTLDVSLGESPDSSCSTLVTRYGASYNYIFKDYNINIKVHENNIYDITEDYVVCYTDPSSHGFYRNIPKKVDGWREDGSTIKTRAIISDVTVTGAPVAEKDNSPSYYNLKIGDPDKTVNIGSEYHYTISYTYDYGEDQLADADEFYFNLIGSEWASDVIFLNASFDITMPKSFTYDRHSLGFSSGPVNRSREARADYSVNGRTISGQSDETFPGGNALTFRLVLPEGYYTGARKPSYPLAIISLCITSLMLLVAYVCFALFGKDNPLKDDIMYDPPKNLNPLELGLLHRPGMIGDAVMGLIMHLAEKGYLEIESDSNGKHFTIRQIKDYDGTDKSEATLLEELFKYSSAEDKKSVTDKELKNQFYTSFHEIQKASKYSQLMKDSYNQKSVILSIILTIVATLVTIAAFVLMAFQISIFAIPAGILVAIFAVVIGIISIIVGALVRKKTDFGDMLFSDVKSYADTVKSTNVLSNQGASYFYYNYAFAYALGLKSNFTKKFKEVVSEPPTWYHGSHFSSLDSFTNSMSSISSSSISSPGGSGGGGGSAGGGAGGGGGGGW